MTGKSSDAGRDGMVSVSLSSYAQRKRRFTRGTILDAAEALMVRADNDDFSMRDLAVEAGMAVTTVFSHFGSKAGVLRGLIDRLLDKIEDAFDRRARNLEGAIPRTYAMAEAGLDTVLEAPGFNQRILGSLLMVGDDRVYMELQRQTNHLWIKALGDGASLVAETCEIGLAYIPEQMTVTFRGALALWIAEGLSEEQFRRVLLRGVTFNLLGFISADARRELIRDYCGEHPTGERP